MSAQELPLIALAQMEVRPGRPDLNVGRMLELIDQARAQGAEVILFPELCVTGYIVGDLWEIDALVLDFAAWSERVRAASAGVTVVFGNVAVDPARIGEDGRLRKYNAVHVCRDGRCVERPGLPEGLPPGVHPKTLHPNYRFFDDDRHFYSLRKVAASAGRSLYDWAVPFTVERRGGGTFCFGVQLCEDIWCQDYCYAGEVLDTLAALYRRGAQAVFNLSSSPWTWQKTEKRNRVVREILSRSPVPFFYVNHVGAQNNGKNVIVFDGDTAVYAPDGRIACRLRPWEEQLVLTRGSGPVAPPEEHVESVFHAVRTGLRHLDHVRGQDNAYLVGVSGGIDSSVVTCLLAQTVGPGRVFAVNTPTRHNAQVTQDNARVLCARLHVPYLSLPIQDLYEHLSERIRGAAFGQDAGRYSGLVDENLQARIRGADILAGLAAKHGLIFTNNGNKTEVALGYATLYGDINGAIAPIADLYKVQVVELARFLNDCVYGGEVIPESLISGRIVPSAELSEAQDVTRGLGDPIRYGYHDAVLRQLIEYRRHPADLVQWRLDGVLFERLEWADAQRFGAYFPSARAWVEDLEWVWEQLRRSYFKRIQAPPIVVLSKRAFGFDLRESQLPAYWPQAYGELKARLLGVPWA
ncbi:MAG: NAD(+) synthase [Candidatus Latescibacterota bacterium]